MLQAVIAIFAILVIVGISGFFGYSVGVYKTKAKQSTEDGWE